MYVSEEPTCQSRPSHITEEGKLHSRIETLLLHLFGSVLYIPVSSKYVESETSVPYLTAIIFSVSSTRTVT
jgi:hypothetical protein